MNERVTGCNRQAEISTILNYPIIIRPLTNYEWESNMVDQSGKDQHHSEFPMTIRPLTSYEFREQQSGTDRQRSVVFWIPKWQSDHLLPMNERTIGWDRQAEISTVLNFPMTIRPLTSYKWKSNRAEQTDRNHHHSRFLNDNQATYKLWMRE